MTYLARWQHLVLPVGIITCLLVLITPVPAWIMDVLLAANIAVALIVLLTTLSVKTALEFSIFPSLLLTTTLSRLVLNVASTRLILTQAPVEHLDAAGQVIRAFGEFVTGDHTAVGIVLFTIIAVIQFVVITKGAGRISEVAARFALDGMPGQQMAIDADLNAGLIDQREAQRRRQLVTQQADFYGAMDGSSKFVRGDAIAGVVITLINIVGGLFIGVFQGGMGLAEAGAVFTKLTIGDGLVSQVPALLISIATGLLVTRSSQAMDLPREFLRQLFTRPQVLVVAAVFLVLLTFTRLPALPLLVIGSGCAGLAYVLTRPPAEAGGETETAHSDQTQAPAPPVEKRIEDYLVVDPMELEIGVGLIRLADPKRGGDLLTQITEVRRRVAAELGIVLPKVRIRDNMQLPRRSYRIKLAGNPVADGSVFPERFLAVADGADADRLPGEPATDPATERPAVWIDIDQLDNAKQLGIPLLDPTTVLAHHVRTVVCDHAADLLSRDGTRHLIEELRKTAPAVVDELIPAVMKLGEVQQVLQRLLREGVPIRPLDAVLEALGDHAAHNNDPVACCEFVRRRLARTLSSRYRDRERRLRVVTLDAALEDRILAGIEHDGHGLKIRLAPETVQRLCDWVAGQVDKLVRAGDPPVVLVSPVIRAALKQLTMARLPRLVVLSYDEITSDTIVEATAVVRDMFSVAA
jgi:flagellar biosynthesis protein FlhA